MLTPNWGMGVNTAGMWNSRLTAKKSRFVIIGLTLTRTNHKQLIKLDKLNVDLSKNQNAHQYEFYTRFQ